MPMLPSRIAYLFTSCFWAMSCLAPAALAQGKYAADEAVLTHFKTVLWPQAYQTQNVRLLDSLLADDYAVIDHLGRQQNKRDAMQALGQPWGVTNFQFTITRIWTDGRTALVVGVGTGSRIDDKGRPYRYRYQSTNVFRKDKNRWRAMASQTSHPNREQ